MPAVTTKIDYTALNERRSALTDSQRLEVDTLMAQAIGYVWGRQDAGDQRSVIEADGSLAFGHVYAHHAIDFETHAIFMRRSIPHGYELWLSGVPLDSREH